MNWKFWKQQVKNRNISQAVYAFSRNKEKYKKLQEEHEKVKKEYYKNGYSEQWHRCQKGDIRPYHTCLCSQSKCWKEEDRNFNVFEEFNKLEKRNKR